MEAKGGIGVLVRSYAIRMREAAVYPDAVGSIFCSFKFFFWNWKFVLGFGILIMGRVLTTSKSIKGFEDYMLR